MSRIGDAVIIEARKYLGKTPYVWGGHNLNIGVDCSGYVNAVLQKVTGKHYSWSSYDYSNIGTPIALAPATWAPGDVLGFDTEGNGRWGHVGFYAGMVDGVPVMFNALNEQADLVRSNPVSSYFAPRLRGVRRVVVDPETPAPIPIPDPDRSVEHRLDLIEEAIVRIDKELRKLKGH